MITADDMTARFDCRMLARLCFDDDVKHDPSELDGSPILRAAIDDAIGELKAALVVAGMYDSARLENLSDESLALAKRIVCEIALAFLYGRRGGEARETVEKIRAGAEEYLDRLRKGERLFSLKDDAKKEQAGQPVLLEPTSVELENLNGITHRVRTYFGNVAGRAHRRKFNRGI